MKTNADLATMNSVIQNSGSGPLPHPIRCRLVESTGGLTLEIGRNGRRPTSIHVPRLHPYDYPLWLTSIIARRCKSIPENNLKAYYQHLWSSLCIPEPIVTVCFGPRPNAAYAQQLHLLKDGLDMEPIGPVLHLEGRAVGERYSSESTRQWTCSISMATAADAEKLKSLIETAHHRVVALDSSTVGIRAANIETWLSVGFSLKQIQTFARKEGVNLQLMAAPKDITLAFRTTKRRKLKA